jgi:hypothetical protein
LLKKYIEEDGSSEYSSRRHGSTSSTASTSSTSSSTSSSSNSSRSMSAMGSHSQHGGGASSSSSFNIKDVEDQDERDLRRYEIQCELNNQGASDLVVDLFMSDISNKVFKENVLLAIALLEGGNTQVQVIALFSFKNKKTFRVKT